MAMLTAMVLRFSAPAYTEMYRLMSNVLSKEMRVLEIATGTGLKIIKFCVAVPKSFVVCLFFQGAIFLFK